MTLQSVVVVVFKKNLYQRMDFFPEQEVEDKSFFVSLSDFVRLFQVILLLFVI
jgi:hypothetical protein